MELVINFYYLYFMKNNLIIFLISLAILIAVNLVCYYFNGRILAPLTNFVIGILLPLNIRSWQKLK